MLFGLRVAAAGAVPQLPQLLTSGVPAPLPPSQIHGDLKPANVLLKAARNDRRGFVSAGAACLHCIRGGCLNTRAERSRSSSRRKAAATGAERQPASFTLCPPLAPLRLTLCQVCKLGDFGLSRALGMEETHIETQVRERSCMDAAVLAVSRWPAVSGPLPMAHPLPVFCLALLGALPLHAARP